MLRHWLQHGIGGYRLDVADELPDFFLEKLRRGDSVSTATLGQDLSGEEMSLLVSLLQKPEILSRSRRSMQDYISKIKERREESSQSSDLRALANKYREKKGYEG